MATLSVANIAIAQMSREPLSDTPRFLMVNPASYCSITTYCWGLIAAVGEALRPMVPLS